MSCAPRVETLIRLPSDLKEWVTARALKNDRSMTGEITNILRDAKDREGESKVASNEKEIVA